MVQERAQHGYASAGEQEVRVSWFSPAEVEARRARVMELFAMGHGRRYIAEAVGITPQRVSQIVVAFGQTFEGRR